MSGYVIPACSTLVLLFSPLNLFRTYPYPDSAVKESDSFFFFFFSTVIVFSNLLFHLVPFWKFINIFLYFLKYTYHTYVKFPFYLFK